MDSVGDAVEAVAQQVIGAAIEVHRELGPGLTEATYERALSMELSMRGVEHACQHAVRVSYKGVEVGEGRVDLLVAGCVVVELKAVDKLLREHESQVQTYLRASGLRLGLLINFNHTTLREGLRRIIR